MNLKLVKLRKDMTMMDNKINRQIQEYFQMLAITNWQTIVRTENLFKIVTQSVKDLALVRLRNV